MKKDLRLFLDDVRDAPPDWYPVKNVKDTIDILKNFSVSIISLDHDLGDPMLNGTGYDVILWIENEVATNNFNPPEIRVHSANPPAAARMRAGIDNIYNLLKKRE